MIGRKTVSTLLFLTMLPGSATGAQTETFPHRSPLLITAETLTHERDIGVITAQGHVEISTLDQVLLADSVSYHAHQDLIIATGNVALLDSDGKVTFADYFELTGNLKQGAARQIRVLLADRSRLAAASGMYNPNQGNKLNKVVYTPCQPCVNKPTAPPLWQIKAMQVTHDTGRQEIEYRDAWLEIWGLPVAYTPYFSHPDPGVKRRSGFLPPIWGSTSDLGLSVRIPYFWVLSPQSDLILEPRVSHKENIVLSGEYRGILANGKTRSKLSVTHDRHGTFRGYVMSDTIYEINDIYRAGLQVERSTDDTYTRRYGFDDKPWLTSYAFLEGFGARSYGAVYAYTFQGLRINSDPGQTPFILPSAVYSYVGTPGWRGSYLSMDTSLLMLHSSENSSNRRLSLTGGWTLPYTSHSGNILTFNTKLRGDVYFVNNVPMLSGGTFNGSTGRMMPEISAEWRYPLIRSDKRGNPTVVEPIVAFVASPPGRSTVEIPNTDSYGFEFDDTNLFKINRFAGLDRVETGSRFNYGLKVSQNYEGIGYLSLLVGQSYRFQPQANFGVESGLENRFSDLIGRTEIMSSGNLSLLHRFRFNQNGFALRRNELTLNAGPKALQLGINYTFINHTLNKEAELSDRHEVTTKITSALTHYWSLEVNGRHNLGRHGGLLSGGVSTRYEDECLVLRGSVSHNRTHDRDFQPGLSVTLQIVLKTLGQMQTRFEPWWLL